MGEVIAGWRFWTSVALCGAVIVLVAFHDEVGGHGYSSMWKERLRWAEAVLAAAAVFGCGAPLMRRGWGAIAAGRVNFYAIAATALLLLYAYGALALLAPSLWPRAWRDGHGQAESHFEIAVILTVVMLYTELRHAKRS